MVLAAEPVLIHLPWSRHGELSKIVGEQGAIRSGSRSSFRMTAQDGLDLRFPESPKVWRTLSLVEERRIERR